MDIEPKSAQYNSDEEKSIAIPQGWLNPLTIVLEFDPSMPAFIMVSSYLVMYIILQTTNQNDKHKSNTMKVIIQVDRDIPLARVESNS